MHCALYAEVVYLQHVGDVPEGVGVLAVLGVPGGGPVAWYNDSCDSLYDSLLTAYLVQYCRGRAGAGRTAPARPRSCSWCARCRTARDSLYDSLVTA